MIYTAEEVRKQAQAMRRWNLPVAAYMLTAYADSLERRAGVTDDVRAAGAMLANCAFNLAQCDLLTERERRSLDESRKAWDAAIAVWPVAAEPAQLREAIQAMAQMLENHEWANLLSGDADIARLDAAISGAIRRTDAEPAQVDVIGTLKPLVRELETIDVPGVVLQQITLLGKFAVAARKLISEAMNARQTEPAQPADSASSTSKPPQLGGCCCGEPCTLGVVHRTDGPCFAYTQPADSGQPFAPDWAGYRQGVQDGRDDALATRGQGEFDVRKYVLHLAEILELSARVEPGLLSVDADLARLGAAISKVTTPASPAGVPEGMKPAPSNELPPEYRLGHCEANEHQNEAWWPIWCDRYITDGGFPTKLHAILAAWQHAHKRLTRDMEGVRQFANRYASQESQPNG